jgi:hypothetical protein
MQAKHFQLALTAKEAISHHDPTTGNDSNILTFNRQLQFVKRDPTDTPVFSHLVEALCEQNPMPASVGALTSRLNLPEWLSAAYIRLLLDIHNKADTDTDESREKKTKKKDGQGLLSGMQRYRMLENRLQTSAVKCSTLHGLWSVLTHDLLLEMHDSKHDEAIAAFWTLPPSVQYSMLTTMSKQHRAVSTLARVWHAANKCQSAEYCAAAKIPYAPQEMAARSFTDEDFPEPPDEIVLDVPAISVNSLRHQLVREPSWLHLCSLLGIEPQARGEGPLPVGADAIFANGGNIEKGASQPSNTFYLAGEIRKAYPSLDLLGGTTSSFDLGESKLELSAWIVCKENADNLPAALQNTAQAQTSVFEMLDEVTRTRHATADGQGQMIYNYETLVAGTQVFVELALTPYTTALTEGALAAALDYYERNDNVIGGQSARGHGHVSVEWLTDKPQGMADYEQFVTERKDELYNGLVNKTLCSGAQVIK